MATKRGPTKRWGLNYDYIFRNRCLLCGKVIPAGSTICSSCASKRRR
jgi:uncharacterized OB-fold protein